MPRVAYYKLTDGRLGEQSEKVRARVEAAWEKQRLRFLTTGLASSATMRPADVRVYCKLDEVGTSLVRPAMSQLQMSARAFHLVRKLARMIANIADSETIQPAKPPYYRNTTDKYNLCQATVTPTTPMTVTTRPPPRTGGSQQRQGGAAQTRGLTARHLAWSPPQWPARAGLGYGVLFR